MRISGVAMTRNLQDGAPYYTISYDDLTGRTDTVTSGSQIHKTVQVHRLCPDVAIMSQRVRAVLRLIREIESVVGLAKPVDIEFAVDKNFSNDISIVVGDEWYAGNLSYHLSSRPTWFNTIENDLSSVTSNTGVIYTGNPNILKKFCPGIYGTIKPIGICMIGAK